jgi:hypothetical protein
MGDVIKHPTWTPPRQGPTPATGAAIALSHASLSLSTAQLIRATTQYVHTRSEDDRRFALSAVEDAAGAINALALLLTPGAVR